MTNKVLSYHNDDNLKKSVISEMKKHQEQDSLIKGTYGVYEIGDFKAARLDVQLNPSIRFWVRITIQSLTKH